MATTLLHLSKVHVRRGMQTVLSGQELTVHGGETVVLWGSNGAGKSTLLETAAGLLPLEKGHVQHGDVTIVDAQGRRRASPLALGVVLQKNGMLGSERVAEHLHCAMSTSKQSIDIEPFLEAFDLTHRANDSIANLSQGQARKVAVLAGLLPAFASQAPGLLLLDEPGAGLDEGAVKALSGWLDELRALGHGLLLATHDERLRNHATHLLDLASGSIEAVEGAPETIATRRPSSMPVRRVSPAVYGVRLHLRTLMWLNTNAMAALLTLGVMLAMGEFMSDLDAMQRLGVVLSPALAAGLCGEPLVAALREERAGVWWRAVSRAEPHAAWLPLVIGAAIGFFSSTALGQPLDTTTLGVSSALCFTVWHGVGWMQRSTQRLARPQAVFVGLLTPVLILPYSLLISLLA